MEKATHAYAELLKERRKKSRVYSLHQSIGLAIADLLEDRSHKALYIRLAKINNGEKLLSLARDIAERKNIKNKGAYFMRMMQMDENIKKKTISQK